MVFMADADLRFILLHRLGYGFLTVSGSEMEIRMSNCDSCSHYQYDEDYECYVCMVDLDEDDMSRFLRGGSLDCSFYQLDNEYLVVRKQM